MRRTLRSLGEGGLKGFEEFRKDTSELCSEELHSFKTFKWFKSFLLSPIIFLSTRLALPRDSRPETVYRYGFNARSFFCASSISFFQIPFSW